MAEANDRAPRPLLGRVLRQIRALLVTTLAVLVILAAVIVGLGRALMPQVDEIRPWLTDQASQRLGLPVTLEKLDGSWPRLTPRLELSGLVVGPPEQPLLEVDQARLDLDLLDLFRPERNPFRLAILGLELVLVQDERGEWGFELGGGRFGERLGRDHLPLLDLRISDAAVQIQPHDFPEIRGRLLDGGYQRRGDRSLLQGQLRPISPDGGAPLDFALLLEHPEGHWRAAQAWVETTGLLIEDWLDLPTVPKGLDVQLAAHLDWRHERYGRVQLDLEVAGLPGELDQLTLELLAERQRGDTRIEIRQLTAGVEQQPLIQRAALGRQGRYWAVAADLIDLGALFRQAEPWLGSLPERPEHLAGRIENLALGLNDAWAFHHVQGQLRELEIALPARFPSLSGFGLGLALAGDRVAVYPEGAVDIDWSGLLRGPVLLDQLAGSLVLGRDHIEVRGLAVGNADIDARASGWVFFDGQPRPYLDLLIEAERIEGIDPRPFLPPRYMPETAIQWLDSALESVTDASGHVLLHMRAGTRSADIQPGHFQAVAQFRNQTIDYWPDWPIANELDGEVRFAGRRLEGRVDQGRLGAVAVHAPQLLIEDLTSPRMTLRVERASDDAQALADLLADLPLDGWPDTLGLFRWAGDVELGLDLDLPFQQMSNWDLVGQGQLAAVDLRLPGLGLRVPGLEGAIDFSRHQASRARLTSATHSPSVLNLEAAFDRPARLDVRSRINLFELIDPAHPLASLAAQTRGQSEVALQVRGLEEGGAVLTLDTDLDGVLMEWPAPFSKPMALERPLSLDLRFVSGHSQGMLSFDDWLQLHWQADGAEWRWAMGLDQSVPDLPEAPGGRIRGQLAHVSLGQWLEEMSRWSLEGTLGGTEMRHGFDLAVTLGQLDVFGLDVAQLPITLERRSSDWVLSLLGESVAGRVTVPVPLDSGRVLAAELERIHLVPRPPPSDDSEAELAQQLVLRQTSTFDPRRLPPLHVLIEDLRWGQLDMGRARVEAHTRQDGMEIEMIELSGDDLRLLGRGRWQINDERIQTLFEGRLSTTDLGRLLRATGHDGTLEARRARLDAELRWPGAPSDFSLARLSGQMELSINDGNIPEARPGAGRLLGLVSFTAIPRRLMLDFRDVFGSGLQFDQISGRFDLASGFARTDGLIMETSAATITIRGDTDMAARQYEQVVIIEPGLGATLPVIGVLAGGPVGAAAGLVLRQILDRPLRGVAEARYSVTGSWDDPVIELIEARVTDEQGEEALIRPEDVELLEWPDEPTEPPTEETGRDD